MDGWILHILLCKKWRHDIKHNGTQNNGTRHATLNEEINTQHIAYLTFSTTIKMRQSALRKLSINDTESKQHSK
jgi:hypothetical protein